MKINTETIKKDYKFYALLAIILCLVIFKTCVYKPVPVTTLGLKPEIHKQDSFRTVIKYRDSVRVKDLIKWRKITRIVDSSVCYTEVKYIIAECDTIIVHDSILIGSLKGEVSLDSTIQNKLVNRILADSVIINKLNKKVKRNRALAKASFIVGLGLGGFVGLKLH